MVVGNGVKSDWALVVSGVSHATVLGPLLLKRGHSIENFTK